MRSFSSVLVVMEIIIIHGFCLRINYHIHCFTELLDGFVYGEPHYNEEVFAAICKFKIVQLLHTK